jgi:hypothetical protein
MRNKISAKTIKVWIYKNQVPDGDLCKIEPSRKFVPAWYKNISKYVGDNVLRIDNQGFTNVGLKGCFPFLDSLNLGYMLTLHCDILVEIVDGSQKISWSSDTPPLQPRPMEIVKEIPSVPGYGNYTQAWNFRHGVLLPKGYSMLITQPLNHFELNTFTTSGVVDADGGMAAGGIPFSIKNDFEGVIKTGTPIMQLIPFKRDDWKLEYSKEKEPKGIPLWSPRNSLYGWYKQNVWKKKSFE